MALYKAKIPVSEGWSVTVDGETHTILERADDDRFIVEHDSGAETVRHIDWFADLVSDADRVVLERDRDE